jgi:hypothetical protein
MRRKSPIRPSLVDLGSAKIETRGAIGPYSDEVAQQQHPGLSRD